MVSLKGRGYTFIGGILHVSEREIEYMKNEHRASFKRFCRSGKVIETTSGLIIEAFSIKFVRRSARNELLIPCR
jgi:hypothetical protein